MQKSGKACVKTRRTLGAALRPRDLENQAKSPVAQVQISLNMYQFEIGTTIRRVRASALPRYEHTGPVAFRRVAVRVQKTSSLLHGSRPWTQSTCCWTVSQVGCNPASPRVPKPTAARSRST